MEQVLFYVVCVLLLLTFGLKFLITKIRKFERILVYNHSINDEYNLQGWVLVDDLRRLPISYVEIFRGRLGRRICWKYKYVYQHIRDPLICFYGHKPDQVIKISSSDLADNLITRRKWDQLERFFSDKLATKTKKILHYGGGHVLEKLNISIMDICLIERENL